MSGAQISSNSERLLNMKLIAISALGYVKIFGHHMWILTSSAMSCI